MKLEERFVTVDFSTKEVEEIIQEIYGRSIKNRDPITLTKVVNLLQKLYFLEEQEKSNADLVKEALFFYVHPDIIKSICEIFDFEFKKTY